MKGLYTLSLAGATGLSLAKGAPSRSRPVALSTSADTSSSEIPVGKRLPPHSRQVILTSADSRHTSPRTREDVDESRVFVPDFGDRRRSPGNGLQAAAIEHR